MLFWYMRLRGLDEKGSAVVCESGEVVVTGVTRLRSKEAFAGCMELPAGTFLYDPPRQYPNVEYLCDAFHLALTRSAEQAETFWALSRSFCRSLAHCDCLLENSGRWIWKPDGASILLKGSHIHVPQDYGSENYNPSEACLDRKMRCH